MKKVIVILAALLSIGPVLGSQELRQGISLGYQEDIAGVMTLDVEKINGNIPFSFGIFAGFSYQFDSGNAEAARKIFINDNAGGTIEKFGTSIFLGADFRYALSTPGDMDLRIFAGPRGVFYQAHYAFLGDNEDFDVRSNQGGVGGGLQAIIPVNGRFDFNLSAGVAYYFPATLQGHGEFLYNPDSVDDNPRNDYTWEDADGAVNQPGLSIPVFFGIRWKL
jgi:hypothetical protein